jgi:phospholipid-binding lipoprotein MlaA
VGPDRPDPLQRSINNFFLNLRFPIVTSTRRAQGKARNGASDVGRFLVNTTVGVLGFMDPRAAGAWSKRPGFRPDARVVGRAARSVSGTPVLGRVSVRDTVGLVGDSAAKRHALLRERLS